MTKHCSQEIECLRMLWIWWGYSFCPALESPSPFSGSCFEVKLAEYPLHRISFKGQKGWRALKHIKSCKFAKQLCFVGNRHTCNYLLMKLLLHNSSRFSVSVWSEERVLRYLSGVFLILYIFTSACRCCPRHLCLAICPLGAGKCRKAPGLVTSAHCPRHLKACSRAMRHMLLCHTTDQ